MHSRIYDWTEFENLTGSVVERFCDLHHDRLVGSAIFSYSDNIVSKVVRWAENVKDHQTGFIPSHTGSIIDYKGYLYIFNMIPPKAYVTPLKYYLLGNNENYKLVMRDFELDITQFSTNLIPLIGSKYPYGSAIDSVLAKHSTTTKKHCSEAHYRALLASNAKLTTQINPECTPLELYNLLTNV